MTEISNLNRLSRGRPGDGTAGSASVSAIPPQRRRVFARIVVPAVLLGSAVLLLLYSARAAVWPALEVRVVPVVMKAAEVGSGGAESMVQAPGWIEADPFAVIVSALTDGVVREVTVLEGQPVEAGQVVARLIDADAVLALARAEAELSARTAETQRAEVDLVAAQSTWDNPIERVRSVATAEAMLAESRAALDVWPAELAAAEARQAELKAEQVRVEKLHEKHQASDIEKVRTNQQYLAQEALVQGTRTRRGVLEAQVAAREAEVQSARENLRLRIPEKAALEQAKAEVERAKSATAQARAARDEAKLRLERTEVRSPVAGIVQARLVEPGSRVMLNANDPQSQFVLRVYDPAKMQVRVDVPLADSAKVGVGNRAEVMTEALPDRVFRGTVTRLVHEANIQKNTQQVKVAIENPVAELHPEMLTRVRIYASSPSTRPAAETGGGLAAYVPRAALTQIEGRNARAWIVDRVRNVATLRNITLGFGSSEGWVEVVDGLRPGDRVIVGNPAGLAEGTRVRIGGEDGAAAEVGKHGHD